MKSNKLKEYIDSKIFTAKDNSGNNRFVVSIGDIKKYVEIAEEEMKIKAIEIFCLTACGGVCPKKTFVCEKRKRFIEELSK